MNITGHDLAYACGKARPNKLMHEIARALNEWLPYYGITDRREIKYLIANMIPETGRFHAIVENLNYSEAALIRTFSFYKRNPHLARKHAKRPQVIANTVYDDKNRSKRYKLGNTQPGDGWRFRGSGPGQMTGRNNFQEFKDATGIDVINKPEILRNVRTGVQAMCVFWSKNKRLQQTARAGQTSANREAYNGGSHGLEMLKKYLPRCETVANRINIVTKNAYQKPAPKPTPVPTPTPTPAPTPPSVTTSKPKRTLVDLFGQLFKSIFKRKKE